MAIGNHPSPGLSGSWEDWCDNGGVADYGGKMASCKLGSGWLVNPFPPPWTDLGKLTRIAVAGAWPDPNDLDPESLVTLPIRDPGYFLYLQGLSSFLGNFPMLSAAAAILSAAGVAGVQQSPFFKTFSKMALATPFPMGSYVSEIALTPPGWALAIQLSLDRAKAEGRAEPWSRPWENIIEPALKDKVDQLFAVLGGTPSIIAYAIRRQARTLPDSQIKAALLALGDESNIGLFNAVKDPSQLTAESTFTLIGDAMIKISPAVPSFHDTLVIMGGALKQFALPLSMLLRGQPGGLNAFIQAATGVNATARMDEISGKMNDATNAPANSLALANAVIAVLEVLAKAFEQLLGGPLGKSLISGDLIRKLRAVGSEMAGKAAPVLDPASIATGQYRADGDPGIWWIEGGKRWHIASMDTVNRLIASYHPLATLPLTQLQVVPDTGVLYEDRDVIIAGQIDPATLATLARTPGRTMTSLQPTLPQAKATSPGIKPQEQLQQKSPPTTGGVGGGGGGMLLAAAGAGFVAGGPVGGLIGAAIGLALDKKGTS